LLRGAEMVSFQKAIVAAVAAFVLSAFLQGCGEEETTTTTTTGVPANACSVHWRGSCSANEEFLPNNICHGSSFVEAIADSNECTTGYSRITSLSDCVAGALALKNKFKINGEDGHSVSTDEATIKREIQKRTIKRGSGFGAHMPYGCYYDLLTPGRLNQAAKGEKKNIGDVWLNLDEAVASKHDRTALICKSNSNSVCSHDTCCKERVGDAADLSRQADGKSSLPEKVDVAGPRFNIVPIISFFGGVALAMITLGLLASGYHRISHMNKPSAARSLSGEPLSCSAESDMLLRAEGGIVA